MHAGRQLKSRFRFQASMEQDHVNCKQHIFVVVNEFVGASKPCKLDDHTKRVDTWKTKCDLGTQYTGDTPSLLNCHMLQYLLAFDN